MAKITIYVPDELKRRMDEVEGVNWSPLACRAFESRLAEIITQRGAKTMRDIAARLPESKRKSDDMTTQQARLDGRRWAEQEAEAEELRRLEENAQAYVGNWPDHFEVNPGDAYGADECFVFVIRPNSDGDRRAASDFWEEVLGDENKHLSEKTPYIQAFAESALEVWEEVKDQL